MDKRPFADPSDDSLHSQLILEYDHYVKTTVKSGGTPLTPDAWMETLKTAPTSETPKPVEYTEKEKQGITETFSSLMIAQGFGSRAERTRAEIKQWYALKREVNRVFEKLVDAELNRRKHNSLTIVR